MPPRADQQADLKKFGELVKERRESRGWAQEVLASAAFSNLDRKGYVSKIENGEQPIKSSTVRSIATALDIDPKDIPSSLRWPEAHQAVGQSDEAMQELYSKVIVLAGREDENARGLGLRDGTLLELARQYTGAAPKDFDEAVASLSNTLEIARQAIERKEVVETDQKAYRDILAKLADIEVSLSEDPGLHLKDLISKVKRYTPVLLVATLCTLLLTSIFLLRIIFPAVWSSISVGVSSFFSQSEEQKYKRIEDLIASEGRGLNEEREYWYPAGSQVVGQHDEHLTKSTNRAYNQGLGEASRHDSNVVNDYLSVCPKLSFKNLSYLDLRKVDFENYVESCKEDSFRDVIFRGALLVKNTLPMDISFENSSFVGATLLGVDFGNIDVSGVNFSCAVIDGADFSEVKLYRQNQWDDAICMRPLMGLPNLPDGLPLPEGCQWASDFVDSNKDIVNGDLQQHMTKAVDGYIGCLSQIDG